jgi:hypothetical protein
MKISEMRVVSWNIEFRRPMAAKRQGGLLRELAPDLMLLREFNPGSLRDLPHRPALGAVPAVAPHGPIA